VEIEDAARETRIAKRFLEALETNAPLDTYPAPVYARAFLREYATFLGVDPEPLVATFHGAEPLEEVHLTPVKEAVPAQARWPARLLLGLSICLLSGLAVLGVLAGRDSIRHIPTIGTSPNRPVAEGSPSPSPGSTTVATQPPAVPTRMAGIAVALSMSDRCWVQAVADGASAYTGMLMPGESKTFRANHELQLTLGNAGGARIAVDGAHIASGSTGQVIHLTFTVQHGHLHVERV